MRPSGRRVAPLRLSRRGHETRPANVLAELLLRHLAGGGTFGDRPQKQTHKPSLQSGGGVPAASVRAPTWARPLVQETPWVLCRGPGRPEAGRSGAQQGSGAGPAGECGRRRWSRDRALPSPRARAGGTPLFWAAWGLPWAWLAAACVGPGSLGWMAPCRGVGRLEETRSQRSRWRVQGISRSIPWGRQGCTGSPRAGLGPWLFWSVPPLPYSLCTGSGGPAPWFNLLPPPGSPTGSPALT